MGPEQPQGAASLIRREVQSLMVTSEDEATNAPDLEPTGMDFSGISPQVVTDLVKATPNGGAAAVNAAAVGSNQRILNDEAITTGGSAIDDSSGLALQAVGTLQREGPDRAQATAILFGQGGRFAGDDEEAETSRASQISDADLGTPVLKASEPLEDGSADADVGGVAPQTPPSASQETRRLKRNDWLQPGTPNAPKGPGSIVYDAGDQIFKEDEAPRPETVVEEAEEEEDELSSLPVATKHEQDLEDDAGEELDAESFQSDEDDACPISLSDRIFNALEETRHPFESETKKFLPKKKLKSIITVDSVAEELGQKLRGLAPPKRIRELAARVCEETRVEVVRGAAGGRRRRRVRRSFRQIFAILLLCNKAETVSMFLPDGPGEVSDLDLPLIEYRRPRSGALELRKRDEHGNPSKKRLRCFEAWNTVSLDFFQQRQWLLLAPYFARDSAGRVRHFKLMERHILPFTFDPDEPYGDEIDGGYARVFMVKIHPEHHRFTDPTPNREFAIKQLRTYDWAKFHREREILKMFSEDEPDPHIVQLLATYEHGRKLHMLFHRAEGNLLEYWTDINPTPECSHKSVLWMAQQCMGITNGLLKLHRHYTTNLERENQGPIAEDSGFEPGRLTAAPTWDSIVTESDCSTLEPNEGHEFAPPSVRVFEAENPGLSPTAQGTGSVVNVLSSSSLLPPQGSTLQFGRHTDITPNNILWFDNQPGEEGGILKVADFGQSELHSDRSKSNLMSSSKVEGWLPYRPPECDLTAFTPQHVNQSYDIWSLGCVFLEFATWMLGGAELFDEFARERRSPDWRCGMPTIVFFELDNDDKTKVPTVILKPEVEDFIDKLHEHPNCTEYFHELLDIIANNMLMVEPHKRMGCSQIAKKLENLHQKCAADRDDQGTFGYATVTNPWCPVRTGTPARKPRPSVDREATALAFKYTCLFMQSSVGKSGASIRAQQSSLGGKIGGPPA